MASDPRKAANLPLDLCDPGRKIALTCPVEGTSWSTRIATAPGTHEQLAVFAPRDTDGPVRRHPGSLIALEIASEQALYRIEGCITEQVSDPAPLWILGGFIHGHRIQRRVAPRLRRFFGCELVPQLAGAHPALSHFVLPPDLQRNLSTTGCYVQGKPALPIGTPVRVILHLQGDTPTLDLTGVIVRQDQPGMGVTGHGIRFVDPAPEQQHVITQFITKYDRRPGALELLA
ncbi:MAG: PilZ domain-containing protein [bacterium]